MSKQFKLPVFRNRNTAIIPGVPVFDVDKLEVKDRIGHGSFGDVYTAKYAAPNQTAQTVVIKKPVQALDSEERKLFRKEIALLKGLNHENVVTIKGASYNPCALTLEYLYFSFAPFGEENKRASSLSDLLLHIDGEYSFDGFEHLVPFAARDILRGLTYLHSHGVAHR